MTEFYAHSLPGVSDLGQWQTLKDHLRNVGELAGRFAAKFGCEDWGRLAGLLHDLGKTSAEFQARIRASAGEEEDEQIPGKVDHSTAGAQFVATEYGMPNGKLLAYLIAGHHAGLPDGASGVSSLIQRLDKKIPDYFPDEFSGFKPNLLLEPPPWIKASPEFNQILSNWFSMTCRLLYSCLVDADFLDTERFLSPEKSRQRVKQVTLPHLRKLLQIEIDRMESGAEETPVNRLRKTIRQECTTAATQDIGLFSLTVPTGGGKTLTSMAFALDHAIKHGLERVIYVIPYTSIIEQNARVFRRIFGNEAVLEHHSNFEAPLDDRWSRLASENWDAPIVVTTNVQFFESFFANRSSRCRKLHNISKSVVILDEAQMLPVPLLLPCLDVLRMLPVPFGSSVVLCTATQPAVHFREDFKQGLTGVREMVADPEHLQHELRRVEIEIIGKVPDQVLLEMIKSHEKVLTIVNTRKAAQNLFRYIADLQDSFHLSALMCPVHRTRELERIRIALQDSSRVCRVVSTQVIEAGVDIDFPVVFRAMAGLDSIAQAAGRCNREGRLKELGRVYVFEPEEGLPTGHFRQAADSSLHAMHQCTDLLSSAAIQAFFHNFIWKNSGNGGLDKHGIREMTRECLGKELNIPFRKMAETFRMIEDFSRPLIIRYDENAEELIKQLGVKQAQGFAARRLQKYTVNISPAMLKQLQENCSVECIDQRFYVLSNPAMYDSRSGLRCDGFDPPSIESLII